VCAVAKRGRVGDAVGRLVWLRDLAVAIDAECGRGPRKVKSQSQSYAMRCEALIGASATPCRWFWKSREAGRKARTMRVEAANTGAHSTAGTTRGS